MTEQLKENILKDILNTGFPLEMEVANYFSRKRWSVDHNSYYIDKDDLKGREIDLIANFFLNNPKSVASNDYFELHCIMPIEIKLANKKPWVFFTSESTSFERSIGRKLIKNDVGFKSEHPDYYSIIKKYDTKLHKMLGRSFYEAFSGNGSRDDIYKALTGSIKALEHLVETFPFEEYKEDNEFPDRFLYLYEPTIVVKGSFIPNCPLL